MSKNVHRYIFVKSQTKNKSYGKCKCPSNYLESRFPLSPNPPLAQNSVVKSRETVAYFGWDSLEPEPLGRHQMAGLGDASA